MALEVQLVGNDQLLAKLTQAQGYLASQRFLALLNDAGQRYVDLAAQSAPKDTRFLARSLNYRVEGFGTPQVKLRIGFDQRAQRYAPHVEFGTGASTRFARNRRWMHWFTAGPGGKTVQQPYGLQGQSRFSSHFAKVVHHPGTRPQPFFLKHLPIVGNRLAQLIRKQLVESLGSGPKA